MEYLKNKLNTQTATVKAQKSKLKQAEDEN